MNHTTVATVMTRHIATAVPDTPYRELVGQLLAHDIDAIPVIDPTGRPLGVVTEHDLFAKLEHHGGADPAPLFARRRTRARRAKAAGLTAADVMTTPAPTIDHHATLGAAIATLADADLRRLCVTDNNGYLVGTLSRRDTLSVFLRADTAIHNNLHQRLNHPATRDQTIAVDVAHGVVTLTGTVPLRSLAE
ncbi:CBS domain-containing protein [Actinokineospora sp. HUAS TT18]|uniref:CBS domain-containing protein n=1 Tax=Actinokineospora sp. HUAS TT18 TaxID=3447451 RepID=UPI003F52440B